MKKKSTYTALGDKGTTSLIGGKRVSKTDQRMEACGTIDELNSFLGLLLTEIDESSVYELLSRIQAKLFDVGAHLVADTSQTGSMPESRITPDDCKHLEQNIDLFDSRLPEIKEFIMPGGCPAAALAHVCRTVCRRAEREIYRLHELRAVDSTILIYINRLSDLLFVIARYESFQENNAK